jgi:hypothetical protein
LREFTLQEASKIKLVILFFSGWMYIKADKFSIEGLGFEGNVFHKTKDGKIVIGIDLNRVNLFYYKINFLIKSE